jgi:hypothetical protein
MTTSISTQALTGAIENPTGVVVDVLREMAAFKNRGHDIQHGRPGISGVQP